MKSRHILAQVSPLLLRTAERYANDYGAARTVFHQIRLLDESALLPFAAKETPRYSRRRGCFTEELLPEQQVLSLAERLVAAVRIKEHSQRGKPRKARRRAKVQTTATVEGGAA